MERSDIVYIFFDCPILFDVCSIILNIVSKNEFSTSYGDDVRQMTRPRCETLLLKLGNPKISEESSPNQIVASWHCPA